jgi:hypothetical protein
VTVPDDELHERFLGLRKEMRETYEDLVDALARRDTYDLALNHSRHPLSVEHAEYLSDLLIRAHYVCEHCERELSDYNMRLVTIERALEALEQLTQPRPPQLDLPF